MPDQPTFSSPRAASTRCRAHIRLFSAISTADRSGIDLELLRRALVDSAAVSEFVRHDLGALLEGDYLASFGFDRCCEELDAVVDLAHELSVPFELSTAVQSAYRRTLDRYGRVDGALLAVALLEEQAGTRLRASTRPTPRTGTDPGPAL